MSSGRMSSRGSDPVYSHGRMKGQDAIEVRLRHEGKDLGHRLLTDTR